jgi:hypothetical protein
LHRSRGRPFGKSQPIEPEPERLLLDQIASGALEAHLTAIADAISARLDLLETIDSAKALAMLNVGDRVRFNYRTRPNTCAASKASSSNSIRTRRPCAFTTRSAGSGQARFDAARPSVGRNCVHAEGTSRAAPCGR